MNTNLPPYRAAAAFALRVLALVLCAVVSSCAVLGNKTPPPLTRYSLEASTASVNVATPAKTAPVLLVEVPHAAAGYDSNRMVYTRQVHTQEVFANSVWADTPARMLAPLLVNRLQQSGQFRAVLLAPSAAKASLRLDTTIVQLQQDFLQVPSRVHLRLQMTLLDNDTREVRAWRAVTVTRDATSDDAAGGARAANVAVQDALQQVAEFLQTELAVCCMR